MCAWRGEGGVEADLSFYHLLCDYTKLPNPLFPVFSFLKLQEYKWYLTPQRALVMIQCVTKILRTVAGAESPCLTNIDHCHYHHHCLCGCAGTTALTGGDG